VYDVTRPDTFNHLSMWLEEVEQYCPGGGREVVKLLIGNNVDKYRVVSRKYATEFAMANGMIYHEASAKTRVGINQVIDEMAQKVFISSFIFVTLG